MPIRNFEKISSSFDILSSQDDAFEKSIQVFSSAMIYASFRSSDRKEVNKIQWGTNE